MTAHTTQFLLNPAARVLWRSPNCVQLELGEHAVVIEGLTGSIVRELTGRPPAPDQEAPHHELADDLIEELLGAGFLVDAPIDPAPPPTPRLAAELSTLRVRHGNRANRVLTARAAAAVVVEGTARAAGPIASLLAAAGVGHVHCTGGGGVRLSHATPGGVRPEEEGKPFATAAATAVRAAAPDCRTEPLPAHRRPDLIVIVADGALDLDAHSARHIRRVAHLPVQVAGERGVIGPLVLPGVSSCLRCADLHRLDRDDAWSALAVQLAVAPRHASASSVALASFAASIAALQALAYLDGDTPAAVDGTLEVQLPDWRVRRRSWNTHPDCSCGAYDAGRADSAE